MEIYDYVKNETQDVIDYIDENIDLDQFKDTSDENFAEYLNDELWTADSVTGNASGSRFCNANEARDCLYGNEDLIKETYQEFGDSSELLNDIDDPERVDCSIRCYLLSKCIDNALEQIDRPREEDDNE